MLTSRTHHSDRWKDEPIGEPLVFFDGVPVFSQNGQIYWYRWGVHTFDIRTMRQLCNLPVDHEADHEYPRPRQHHPLRARMFEELRHAMGAKRFSDLIRLHDNCRAIERDATSVFTLAECQTLREDLTSAYVGAQLEPRIDRSRSPFPASRWTHLAVVPGGTGAANATVHFVPEAGDQDIDQPVTAPAAPEQLLRATLASSCYHASTVDLQSHRSISPQWPAAWSDTATTHIGGLPTLLVMEGEDGSVAGVVVRGLMPNRAEVQIADATPEPHDARSYIDALRALQENTEIEGGYKETSIDAASLTEAIETSPESTTGQKFVLVYRQDEWLHGLWNNPLNHRDASPMQLASVADCYGTRISTAKRQARAGLDHARTHQTMVGDYAVLLHALSLLPEHNGLPEGGSYEALPAIEVVCRWWNEHAPPEMRPAACFRIYTWDEATLCFQPEDPEEPAMQADTMAAEPTYALFEQAGYPTRALVFFRGRAYNTLDGDSWTATYFANGDRATTNGIPPDQVDEAWYTLVGLRNCLSQCEAGATEQ